MSIDQCKAWVMGDLFHLENSRIHRQFLWNNGHPISRLMADKNTSRVWDLTSESPDCELPGQTAPPRDSTLEVTRQKATHLEPAHLRVDCSCSLGALQIRRRFRLYPDIPAISCDYYLRGTAAPGWQSSDVSAEKLANIEDNKSAQQGRLQASVMERLCTSKRHLHLTCVQFYDLTDRRNDLLSVRTILPYHQQTRLAGNLLLVRDLLQTGGLFILKEAPCSDMQLAWPGCDFVCEIGQIQAVGMGIQPSDIQPDEWVRAYGVVTGVAEGSEHGLLSALREYQSVRRLPTSSRDQTIMLNTWGDRSATARISESFCLRELESGHRLNNRA